MNFSQMSSREKTVVAVLGVVILVALIGIGVLVARLVTGGQGEEPEIVVIPTTTGEATTGELGQAPAPGSESETAPDITPVAPPSLEGLDTTPPAPVSAQAAVVIWLEGIGPGLPVSIPSQTLHAGRRYRLEITTTDGSAVPIQGSWGQSATSASGKVVSPQIELFEGVTPFQVDLVAPVPDPVLWSCSASAGLKELMANPPTLVITIWDVSGIQ
jgi:hypothetical protein